MADKKKSSKKSIIQIIFTVILFICLITIALISGLWILGDIKQNQNQIQYEIEQEKLFQKRILKEHVTEIIQYIGYMQSLTKERLEQSIQQKTLEAHAITTNIYQQYKDTLPREKIIKLITDALRPIRFNNKRGYYFAAALSGYVYLFADKPELEGENIFNMQDSKGQFVIQDMVRIVQEKSQGFYKYNWTKPDNGGKRVHEKIAFVKYFAPYDCFIGTGEYLSDVEQDIQNEVIKRIEKIKFSDNGYVFAGTLEGTSLSGPAKGKDMINVTDINGVKIVQELIKAAKTKGGFVEYELPAFKGYIQHKKISFSMAVPGWDWYLGAGLNMESFDILIKNKEAELQKRIQNNTIKIIFSMAILAIIIALLITIISNRLRSSFKVFDSFFANAAIKKEKINTDSIHFAEFEPLASSANKMIGQIIDSENKIKDNQKMMVQSEKMISVGGLAAGMAHEINNPLSIILGSVQLVKMRLDPKSEKNLAHSSKLDMDFEKLELYLEENSIHKYLDQVQSACERAAYIVKKMLGFSRKSDSKKSEHKIAHIIDNTLDIASNDYDLKKKYDFRSFEIIREYEPDLKIFCWKNEIIQVILNIITNSAHATIKKDGFVQDHPKIIVKTRQKNSSCIIEIIDNGSGMDKKTIDRIFEPFYTTKSPGSGTGLGMSVSYFIITNNHNGTMKVESEPGKGSRFIIELPH
jgi:signal transduction histidine kinase